MAAPRLILVFQDPSTEVNDPSIVRSADAQSVLIDAEVSAPPAEWVFAPIMGKRVVEDGEDEQKTSGFANQHCLKGNIFVHSALMQCTMCT